MGLGLHDLESLNQEGAIMKLLAGCDDGNCPKVYETENGDYVVQGYTVAPAELGDLPAGESAVQIPRALLAELLAKEEVR
jgi:hypothetical protein